MAHSAEDAGGVSPLHSRLLDRLPAVVAVVDASGVLRAAEGGVEELVGLTSEEVVGRNITDFVRIEDVEAVVSSIAYATSLSPGILAGPMRMPYRHADGTWRVTEVWSANAMDDPDIQGIECLFLFESANGRFDEVLTSMAEGHSPDRTLPMLAGALTAFPVMSESFFVEETGSGLRFHRPGGGGEMPGPGLAGPWDEVLSAGVTVELPDLSTLPAQTRQAAEAAGFCAVWAYPVHLALAQRLAAALVVWRTTTEPPTPNQRDHIDRAVTIASLVFSRRLAEQQLREAAFHDPLTGVANRRLLHSLASEHAAGTEEAVALLYVDLDGFKAVNDRHGHVTGDTVLAEVARRISAAVRPSDHVVRLGGDEFAIVCRSLGGSDEAVRIASRVIEQITRPVTAASDLVVQVGASVGIACTSSTAATFDDLIKAADRALYEAKARGRGTWCLVGGDEEERWSAADEAPGGGSGA
jgi:diguanylate cyclase (GGDEF)-like protein/PAS domain S-box-containing protein